MKTNKRASSHIRIVADNSDRNPDRPLYAGKVVVKKPREGGLTMDEISVPLVAWLARGPK